uniref:Small ribosomal subunit protein uS3m n=1 Tax=Apiotrichum gracile TaxID=82516 RepID=A0A8K1ZR50_9TREE|nr:ribosomal protein S3 [Apiotrichum gracile]
MRLTKKYIENYLSDNNQLSTNYNFNKNLKTGQVATLNACRIRIKIINYFFAPIEVLSSKPVFTITRDEVIISLFYYTPEEEGALNTNKINNLGEFLTKIFNRPVKLQFVKLYYPHLNSDILAQYLRMNARKYHFRHLKGKLFKNREITKNPSSSTASKLKLPSHIVGIKIQISGRLVTERVRPRQTVSTAQVGPISSNNDTLLVDFGSYTGKNANGAFTVKVWTGQRVSPIS